MVRGREREQVRERDREKEKVRERDRERGRRRETHSENVGIVFFSSHVGDFSDKV
jgi:hypothetical protein